MDIDKVTKEAIGKLIAEKVLGELDENKRSELLIAGISGALDSYDTKEAFRKAVAHRAGGLVSEHLATGAYDNVILTIFEEQFQKIRQVLPEAIRGALVAALAGKETKSTYERGYSGLYPFLTEALREDV